MIPMYWSYRNPLSLKIGKENLAMSIEVQLGIGVLRYIRYSGTMMTWGGSRLPAVKIIKVARLKRQLNWVHAKATIEARRSVSTTAGIAITSVLR